MVALSPEEQRDFEALKLEVATLKARVRDADETRKIVEETNESVIRMEQALLGWEGHGGLMNDVTALKREYTDALKLATDRITALEDVLERMKGAAGFIGGAWGAVGALVVGALLLILEKRGFFG